MLRSHPNIRLQDVWNKFGARFPDWLKYYVSHLFNYIT